MLSLTVRDEFKRSGVEAIALPCGRRTVWKDVTQMCTAPRVDHFNPRHEGDARVGDFDNVIGIDRLVETRPTSAGVKFGARGENRQVAYRADVDAWLRNGVWVAIDCLPCETALSALFDSNVPVSHITCS